MKKKKKDDDDGVDIDEDDDEDDDDEQKGMHSLYLDNYNFKPCGQHQTYVKDVNRGMCLQIHADPKFFRNCQQAINTCPSPQQILLRFWFPVFHKNLQGFPPKDGRGKHTNRPHRVNDDQRERIQNHISSFRGRLSHYSRHKTRKLYLPSELNIMKMFTLYQEKYSDDSSYDTYRNIFNGEFNISFGYPRTDTCANCDEFVARLKLLDKDLTESPDDASLLRQKGELLAQREVHQRKSETFYERKRSAKAKAKTTENMRAVAFDFQKELYCPNKTSNDVYYRRQLAVHSFNIHDLGSDSVNFYCYDETIGKKGNDAVASMLFKYLLEIVPETVKHIEFFCDSCCGQNKNYTIFRFFYYLVHCLNRFDSIRVTFPERGHSYMECDRDFAIVKTKSDVELPQEWYKVIREARKFPTPYNVHEMSLCDFKDFTNFFKPLFKAMCPFPTRPVKEIIFAIDAPGLATHRSAWNGPFESSVLVLRSVKAQKDFIRAASCEPKQQFCHPLPISDAKHKDLQVLKKFCSPETHSFYDNLPHDGALRDHLHEETEYSDAE
ncbi:hypothetical protein PoB_002771100 [Plakobranchus ocellatus]|uniref:DUF7869 domain-containing protein n=1 Tax=Plakobranchus ocellatus TaxID=259542 RepID=A0AAV3ZZ61_9GAST|nr:hypothetical protein PoB_002771100 [Plakobranchus ocellatus]